MKAKELMIWDWVWYGKQPHQIRQLGIFGENRDGDDYPAVCVGKPNGIGIILERNEIEPIPLTPKILEKNGFKKIREGRFLLEDLEDNYWVKFYPKDANYTRGSYDYINLDCGCISIREMPIEFVHELQHVLRLCGIEKEIEL